jgi:hypothetical protein
MDKETKAILVRNKWISEIISHEGWKYVVDLKEQKLAELRNAFNLEDSDPQKMHIDLLARKLATVVIQEIFAEIEGAPEVVKEATPLPSKSYVVKLN